MDTRQITWLRVTRIRMKLLELLIFPIHAMFMFLEWKDEPEGARCAWLYKSMLLSQHETGKAVVLQMDLRDSIVNQERSLLSLYKAPKVEWANPICCKLEGISTVLGNSRVETHAQCNLFSYCLRRCCCWRRGEKILLLKGNFPSAVWFTFELWYVVL